MHGLRGTFSPACLSEVWKLVTSAIHLPKCLLESPQDRCKQRSDVASIGSGGSGVSSAALQY